QDGDTYFTANDKETFAITLIAEGSNVPKSVSWKGNLPKKGSVLKLVSSGKNLKYTIKGDVVTVSIPSEIGKDAKAALAFSFKK
ncbi:MAG: alpha-L-fucosidase, partial [Leeuwenhoekiella sp.]|nr:alpha-L-fucosidase [Leeuwenhoekiella sp.]